MYERGSDPAAAQHDFLSSPLSKLSNAETLMCLQLDLDAALACYQEALKLEPRTGWLLDAYGSLLADMGRYTCVCVYVCVCVCVCVWLRRHFGTCNLYMCRSPELWY
jgi:hypothetical protein